MFAWPSNSIPYDVKSLPHQGSTNVYTLMHSIANAWKDLRVRMWTETLFLNAFHLTYFPENVTFAIFSKDAPMIPIKHNWKDNS